MKSHLKISSGVIVATTMLLFAAAAYAQTTYTTTGSAATPGSVASMPTFYDANGVIENNTAGNSLPAGYYYVNGSPAQGGHQIYYYGNGTYYDPSTGTYGGSTLNPNGTAGAGLGYTVLNSTPGFPNTGLGGKAESNWLMMAVAGIVALSGAMFLLFTRRVSRA